MIGCLHEVAVNAYRPRGTRDTVDLVLDSDGPAPEARPAMRASVDRRRADRHHPRDARTARAHGRRVRERACSNSSTCRVRKKLSTTELSK